MQTTTPTASTLPAKQLRAVCSALNGIARGRSFTAATRDMHPELAAHVQAYLDAAAARREQAAAEGW